MATTVSFKYLPGPVDALTNNQGDVVMRDTVRRGHRVEARAKQLCPVHNGRLRSSIVLIFVNDSRQNYVIVGSPLDYAEAVHNGTGIYGPKGRPIRPRRGQYLRFVNQQGQVVYARQVKGVRGRPFLLQALPAAAD